jgi:hypothetical protein
MPKVGLLVAGGVLLLLTGCSSGSSSVASSTTNAGSSQSTSPPQSSTAASPNSTSASTGAAPDACTLVTLADAKAAVGASAALGVRSPTDCQYKAGNLQLLVRTYPNSLIGDPAIPSTEKLPADCAADAACFPKHSQAATQVSVPGATTAFASDEGIYVGKSGEGALIFVPSGTLDQQKLIGLGTAAASRL